MVLELFLSDNPIIVSRAVSIALAISSSANQSCNLQHFPFDSAIFWQFKAISRGLTRTGIDFVFPLIMLIRRKSAFSSRRLIAALGGGLNCADALRIRSLRAGRKGSPGLVGLPGSSRVCFLCSFIWCDHINKYLHKHTHTHTAPLHTTPEVQERRRAV